MGLAGRMNLLDISSFKTRANIMIHEPSIAIHPIAVPEVRVPSVGGDEAEMNVSRTPAAVEQGELRNGGELDLEDDAMSKRRRDDDTVAGNSAAVDREQPVLKRGRGRPRKNPLLVNETPMKRGRGRPKKNGSLLQQASNTLNKDKSERTNELMSIPSSNASNDKQRDSSGSETVELSQASDEDAPRHQVADEHEQELVNKRVEEESQREPGRMLQLKGVVGEPESSRLNSQAVGKPREVGNPDQPIKRGPGRPRKYPLLPDASSTPKMMIAKEKRVIQPSDNHEVKRGRGRPRKDSTIRPPADFYQADHAGKAVGTPSRARKPVVYKETNTDESYSNSDSSSESKAVSLRKDRGSAEKRKKGDEYRPADRSPSYSSNTEGHEAGNKISHVPEVVQRRKRRGRPRKNEIRELGASMSYGPPAPLRLRGILPATRTACYANSKELRRNANGAFPQARLNKIVRECTLFYSSPYISLLNEQNTFMQVVVESGVSEAVDRGSEEENVGVYISDLPDATSRRQTPQPEVESDDPAKLSLPIGHVAHSHELPHWSVLYCGGIITCQQWHPKRPVLAVAVMQPEATVDYKYGPQPPSTKGALMFWRFSNPSTLETNPSCMNAQVGFALAAPAPIMSCCWLPRPVFATSTIVARWMLVYALGSGEVFVQTIDLGDSDDSCMELVGKPVLIWKWNNLSTSILEPKDPFEWITSMDARICENNAKRPTCLLTCGSSLGRLFVFIIPDDISGKMDHVDYTVAHVLPSPIQQVCQLFNHDGMELPGKAATHPANYVPLPQCGCYVVVTNLAPSRGGAQLAVMNLHDLSRELGQIVLLGDTDSCVCDGWYESDDRTLVIGMLSGALYVVRPTLGASATRQYRLSDPPEVKHAAKVWSVRLGYNLASSIWTVSADGTVGLFSHQYIPGNRKRTIADIWQKTTMASLSSENGLCMLRLSSISAYVDGKENRKLKGIERGKGDRKLPSYKYPREMGLTSMELQRFVLHQNNQVEMIAVASHSGFVCVYRHDLGK